MGLRSFLSKLLPKSKKSEELPVSMVLLLRQPHFFTDSELRTAGERAWQTAFTEAEDSKYFVVQRQTVTLLKAGPSLLSLLYGSRPYLDLDDKALRTFLPDSARQKAWKMHDAWCAVDHVNANGDLPRAYSELAKLVAEMADQNCTAVYVPGAKILIPNGDLLGPALQQIASGSLPITHN